MEEAMNTQLEATARKMFDAYNEEGPNPWKTFDGRDVPRWEALGEQVRSKWLAAAKDAVGLFTAKDAAYAERNQCVALLARMALAVGWRAGVAQHPAEDTAWEDDWRTIVFIDLPTGQVSWHFHDSELHLLAGLPKYPGKWDSHTTAQKYERVNATLRPQ